MTCVSLVLLMDALSTSFLLTQFLFSFRSRNLTCRPKTCPQRSLNISNASVECLAGRELMLDYVAARKAWPESGMAQMILNYFPLYPLSLQTCTTECILYKNVLSARDTTLTVHEPVLRTWLTLTTSDFYSLGGTGTNTFW